MDSDYNTRLFSGGLRKRYHEARFHWVAQQLQTLGLSGATMLEFGCFDGKLLRFLAQPPVHYVGVDANWEGGLDLARQHYSGPSFAFYECHAPPDLAQIPGRADVVVSMETLEHLPRHQLGPYLLALADKCERYMLITVPNELGLPFFTKHLAKVARKSNIEHYSPKEFLFQTFMQSRYVEQNQHKGFDYRELAALLKDFGSLEAVVPVFPGGALALSFTVGMVLKRGSGRA